MRLIVPYLFLALACFFDLEERRIPNEITYGMFITGLLYQALKDGLGAIPGVLGWTAVCLGLVAILSKAFRLGGGDIKLAMASAAWLREYTPVALFIAFSLIIVWTVVLAVKKYGVRNLLNSILLEALYHTKLNLGVQLPGAVFLALGYAIADCLWNETVIILA
ncbi:hypothetical protein AN618_21210 [Fervidicola ferrireducens]|uniref:Prepilin type IV endopeptidase peptidase domain-containing protein n=1 Tax=Fervidicola ferrireducens TaxID=520764 RepID=A0A140L329_9FIRM|nr:A24 family peptidase [Fervidicola ferrireducens]KXG74954.1 hypothetical protein AN618_21210 [Fervidicola ferrireducens]